MKVRLISPFQDAEQIGSVSTSPECGGRRSARVAGHRIRGVHGGDHRVRARRVELLSRPSRVRGDQLVLEGSGILVSEGEEADFVEGQAMWVPKGVHHQHRNTGTTPPSCSGSTPRRRHCPRPSDRGRPGEGYRWIRRTSPWRSCIGRRSIPRRVLRPSCDRRPSGQRPNGRAHGRHPGGSDGLHPAAIHRPRRVRRHRCDTIFAIPEYRLPGRSRTSLARSPPRAPGLSACASRPPPMRAPRKRRGSVARRWPCHSHSEPVR